MRAGTPHPEGETMSVQSPQERARAEAYAGAPARYEEQRGAGWILFAGVMLMIAGIMNFIGGIAAIDDANFWVNNAQFMISNLNTWGWVLLITGAVQVLAAMGIWARNQPSRWLGVGFASLNALAQLFMIAAFPLWSLALFTLDILVIYGLLAYGQRQRDVDVA
jgi:hypothetical protein